MHDGTHLATVNSEMYEGKWERFHVRQPVRIWSVSPCLLNISIRNGEIVDISRGAATIDMSTVSGLGEHYYIEVTGLVRRIGCAEIFRRDRRVSVKFIATIPEAMLHRIVRADFLLGDDVRQRRPGPAIGFPPGMGRSARTEF